MTPALGARSPNCSTAREFSKPLPFIGTHFQPSSKAVPGVLSRLAVRKAAGAQMGKNNTSYFSLHCLPLHHTVSGEKQPHNPHPSDPSPVPPSGFHGGRNCSSQSLSLPQQLDGPPPNSKGFISTPDTTPSSSEAGLASRLAYSWEN